MLPRHPEIRVQLSGHDGNGFAILGRVRRAMQRAGVPQETLDQFTAEATSGDYNHLLRTCMEWVDCDPNEEEEEDDSESDEAATDTALHKELLGENLDKPWPEEILEELRIRARQLGVSDSLIER